MPLTKELYDTYITILNHELMPALGCTEPIAIASYISQEDVLEALQEFVESFYGYTLHAIYSYKFPDEKLPHYQSDGRQYVFYPGEDITDVEGLHFYEYEL